MNDESTVLPCPKRAVSDVLEGVVLNIFSGGKPPDPQGSLKQVETFVHDKCSSIDHLHLKDCKFIATERGHINFGLCHLSSHVLLGSSRPAHPPRIFSSTTPGSIYRTNIGSDRFTCRIVKGVGYHVIQRFTEWYENIAEFTEWNGTAAEFSERYEQLWGVTPLHAAKSVYGGCHKTQSSCGGRG